LIIDLERVGQSDIMSTPKKEGNFYFVPHHARSPSATLDVGSSMVLEGNPAGTSSDDFSPKPVNRENSMVSPVQLLHEKQNSERQGASIPQGGGQPKKSSFLGYLFGKQDKNYQRRKTSNVTTGPQKKSVKIDPKVFFANERTFLAWLHSALLLAGASVAIQAFADRNENPVAKLYGLILLPVAIAFIFYAMYQCKSKQESCWYCSMIIWKILLPIATENLIHHLHLMKSFHHICNVITTL
jgi:uncharacterized membrane protein YidH (DUF202 family)